MEIYLYITFVHVTTVNEIDKHEFEREQGCLWESLVEGKGIRKWCYYIIISKGKGKYIGGIGIQFGREGLQKTNKEISGLVEGHPCFIN